MNTVDPLDRARLEALLSRYDIGRPVHHWPAAAGVENRNYFLTTRHHDEDQEYVLTILQAQPYSGGALIPLLDACIDAGLPVPRAIRTRDDAAFTELDDQPVLICSRLRGRHPYNPTERQVQALGRFLARFHHSTSRLPFELPSHPRDLSWLTDRIQSCRHWLPYGEQSLMQRTLDTLSGALSRRDVAGLPRGPVHGDLFRDNALFNEHGLTGVLDFHQAAHGYLLYDLAVAVNDWCTDEQGGLDPDRTLALLRSYHALRPLTRQELWHFPLFALYAALSFWVSRQVAARQAARERPAAGAAVRVKDPHELRRVLEQHQRHFFYLDPRRLG